jgi:hypothetical protein
MTLSSPKRVFFNPARTGLNGFPKAAGVDSFCKFLQKFPAAFRDPLI